MNSEKGNGFLLLAECAPLCKKRKPGWDRVKGPSVNRVLFSVSKTLVSGSVGKSRLRI